MDHHSNYGKSAFELLNACSTIDINRFLNDTRNWITSSCIGRSGANCGYTEKVSEKWRRCRRCRRLALHKTQSLALHFISMAYRFNWTIMRWILHTTHSIQRRFTKNSSEKQKSGITIPSSFYYYLSSLSITLKGSNSQKLVAKLFQQ